MTHRLKIRFGNRVVSMLRRVAGRAPIASTQTVCGNGSLRNKRLTQGFCSDLPVTPRVAALQAVKVTAAGLNDGSTL